MVKWLASLVKEVVDQSFPLIAFPQFGVEPAAPNCRFFHMEAQMKWLPAIQF